ncbi:hypothetical protein B0H13DRAFT_2286317 [Mycena leptocephala]|nr:hypothetical protein B0H13DRAFT_2286317 [Mycena leptocephala]
MPSLPSSSPSAPSFSLSPSGVVALVVVVVLVLVGCAMHFVVVPFVSRKIKERRVNVVDAEEAPGAPIPTAQSFISIGTQSIAAAALVAARANMDVTLKASMRPNVPAVCVAKVLANVAPRCHLKQLEEYEVLARFDTRRRRALPNPSPLRTVICAHELKKTGAAAALVAGRSNLPVTLKASVRPNVPAVCIVKVLANVAPRCHLKQLEEHEVPAHFDTRRRRALPGPSPLRAVICAHDLKKTAAAAVLVAGRSNLPVTSKASVRPKVPAVCIAKVLANVAPRCHLKQLNEYEVPARFGPRRARVLPGPSPLRIVVCAAQDAPVAVPVPSSPTVHYVAQDAPVTAPAPSSPSSPTRVLGSSQLTNLRQSARAKQPAVKASKGASKRRPARRMFIGEKENGQPFRFPPQAVAA